MSILSLIGLALQIVKWMIDRAHDQRLIDQTTRDLLRKLVDELDAKVAQAINARNDVMSGRVSIDPTTDPNNRANRK